MLHMMDSLQDVIRALSSIVLVFLRINMQQSTRIHSLDIIRGIAILCILFANLPTMTGLDALIK